MTQIAVLAGGLGTRMLPLTETTPKVLLEVRGRPFLAHLLDRLAASGASSVVLLVGHQGDVIAEAFERPPLADHRRRLEVTLSFDAPGMTGTANALVSALPCLEETFVVTYGDSYLPFDYTSPAHTLLTLGAHADACMAVFENHDAIEPSNCRIDGDWVVRYRKRATPSDGFRYIDYGAMALRRSVIEALPRVPDLGLEVLQEALAARGRLLALPVAEPFHEIGSREGLARLEGALS